MFTPENVIAYPATARAIDTGADPADLATALTCTAYEAMFGVLYLLEYHCETESGEDALHGWALVNADIEEGAPVPGSPDASAGLYGELLMADQLGLEGQDFLT